MQLIFYFGWQQRAFLSPAVLVFKRQTAEQGFSNIENSHALLFQELADLVLEVL